MTRGWTVALAAVVIAGCAPNPRNQIAAVAEATLASATLTCVERTIAPWAPSERGGVDAPAPPGFETLRTSGRFRGGGGLKGDQVAGVSVRTGPDCVTLRGPVIAGARAMIEMRSAGRTVTRWLQRTDARWRVVATTSASRSGRPSRRPGS